MTETHSEKPMERPAWRSWLRRVVLVSLAVLAGVTTVQTFLGPPQIGLEIGVGVFGYLMVGAVVAAVARLEALSRCQPWRRWAILSLLFPFIAPFVLLAIPTPRIGGVSGPVLVREFGGMYDELVRAEAHRRMEQHLPLSGMAIAEVAVSGARLFVMSNHHLSPAEAEQVAVLFARTRR
jgi:hypothetical protein